MRVDRDRMLDVLDRAHSGPVSREHDWNMSVQPNALRGAMKKYGLVKSCNPATPVNLDDDLADRFFQAGLDVALETGMLCTDTHRAIKFTREELLSAVDAAPAEFWLGDGAQRVHFKRRHVEDPQRPVWTAPLSIVVTEDIFVDMVEGIARVAEVDTMQGPSLETLWGRTIRSGSPYELVSGHYQASLMKAGLERAGRWGLPLDAVASSTTHYGVLGGYGIADGYRPDRDYILILNPADLRTSYESLFKLAHAYDTHCDNVYAGSWSMLGGYAGGPEGTAVTCIASTFLLFATFQPSRGGCFPFDLHYMGNTDRKAQWALGIVYQALTRNTHLFLNSVLNQVAGPCTKMLLYESLVGMTNLAASGASSCTGTRSAGGRRTNHLTPLEIKFAGKVFKQSAGMSREQANVIANRFIPNYESELRTPPDGKSIKDCYHMDKMLPTDEWQRMYDEVVEEAARAGLVLA